MASRSKHAVAAGKLICLLIVAGGCTHRAGTKSLPSSAPTTALIERQHMISDQVNTAGWQKAWTNLVNDVEQGFTPTLPRLEAVEVDLVVGNSGETEDLLTLTVLDGHGKVLSAVSKTVQTGNCDQVIFEIPNGGIEVIPGKGRTADFSGSKFRCFRGHLPRHSSSQEGHGR